jgi:hypothetical protein
MAYLVKALGACKAPIKPDVDAVWAANEIREVDDALYSYYRNRSVAFTILAGPGAAANLAASLTAADIEVGGEGAASFTELSDVPASYTGQAGRVPVVNNTEDGLAYDPVDLTDVLLTGGPDGGNVIVQGGSNGGNIMLTAGDNSGRIDLHAFAGGSGMVSIKVGDALTINDLDAVASQSVLVAGVGTLVFTHGLLTSFTPV